MIPKILHFVWIGGEPLPSKYVENMEKWKQHHPNWETRLWKEIPEDVEWRWITCVEKRPVMLADLLRFEVVHRHGGVYADLDTWPVQSIERVLDGVEAFVGRNRGGEIDNPIFGATAGNPWLKHILQKIWVHYRPGVAMGLMGANLICRTISHYPSVRIFDSEIVNASPNAQPTAATVVIHSTDRSWVKSC